MPNTTFSTGTTIEAEWLNEANDAVFDAIGDGTNAPTTGAEVRTNIGAGDVVGPASATDNAIVRFDLTTGKLIQDSDVTLSDADAMTFPTGGQVLLDDSITAAGAALPLAFDGDPNTGLFSPAADKIAIATAGAEAMRINATSVISIGTTAETVSNSNSTAPAIIYSKNATTAVGQFIRHTSPGAGGFLLQFASTRGTDANSYTVVQSGDGIGTLNFMASDGTQYVPACQIIGQVDGTPGANDMPGRLIFLTTADGAASPTERMRIANGGNIYCTGAGTTASAANAFLDSGSTPANELLRSTSSLRYKTSIEPVEESRYRRVLDLEPIWYRSLAKADNPEWSWYGFGAEQVAAIDPRLVSWGYPAEAWIDEEITNSDGKQLVRKLKEGAVKVPDGVAYERIPVLMLPLLKECLEKIKQLEAEIALLKQK
jgi:hypothetical protein